MASATGRLSWREIQSITHSSFLSALHFDKGIKDERNGIKMSAANVTESMFTFTTIIHVRTRTLTLTLCQTIDQ